ncbi:MAG: PhpK family radical SAM P-methyltransferase [Nocardioides sp.]
MKYVVVVGHHETETSGAPVAPLTEPDPTELPPPLRSLLRSTVALEGRGYTYLDALSHARRAAGHDDGDYTVWELPSLGTLYLTSFLADHGLPSVHVNSFTYERPDLARLLAGDPLLVAVTTTFYMTPAPAVEVVRFLHTERPDVPVVVGGPLVDNLCRAYAGPALDRVLDRIGADIYVWESQGEATLVAVARAVSDGQSPADVPNVLTRSATGWRLSSRRPEVNDIDRHRVRWSQFPREVVGDSVSTRTARSCAFACAFCDYPSRAGALTLANLEMVEQELEELARLGVRRVTFIDDTFNVPTRRFKELCRMLVRRDFGIEWFSYFRCGHARTREMYDLMYDSGCRGVLLGIESGDDSVLASMDKRATTADYRFGIEQLRERGIFTHASFVIGFPGETEQTVDNTIRFIEDTGPDTFTVNHWYYLDNTPVHARAGSLGLNGAGHTWSHATMNSAQALDAADRVFHNVRAAAWMPVTGLDFWGVPYLLSKGMSRDQVVQLLRLARPLTAGLVAEDPISGRPVDTAAATKAFVDFCADLPIQPARYRPAPVAVG